jgi:hypothetical protein
MSRTRKPVERRRMLPGRQAVALCAAVLALGACSSKGVIFSSSRQALDAGSRGFKGGAAGQGGAPSVMPPPTGGADGGIILRGLMGRDGGGVCAPYEIDPKTAGPPPGLLLLVDVSARMGEPVTGGSWWSSAAAGIVDFVDHPPNALVSVGVQYFPAGSSQTRAPTLPAACTSPYDRADVDIASLQDTAHAIVGSLTQLRMLGGPSTLGPALKGALAYMKRWALTQPGRPSAVVVLTHDAAPVCAPAAPGDIAAVAADAMKDDPKIATYVIGLGDGLDALDGIAAAGGTKAATRITDDVWANVTRVLWAIAGSSPSACTFVVPKPKAARSMRVLQVLRGATSSVAVTQLNGPADCATTNDVGWYQNDVMGQTTITLCPATCTALVATTVSVHFVCSAAP